MTTRKSNQSANRVYQGQHRFEHWYRDNQVYFFTVRCHHKFPAFASEEAKAVFWSRFEQYTSKHSFTPWVTSLMNNHYHTLGYLKYGNDLAPMMKGVLGSNAKLVNDLPEPRGLKSPSLTKRRLVPFRGEKGKTCSDGCIRDELQARRAYW